MSFSKLPPGASPGTFTPFQLSIPQEKVDEMHNLIKVSKVAPKTFENSVWDKNKGMSHEWLTKAIKEWSTSYDWRDTEKHINSFPNFIAKVQDDDGSDWDIHFVALFSEKKDATPIIMLHGWPGSFLEFLPLLTHVQSQYSSSSPSALPYHLIIPSIPGYTLSSGPPVTKDLQLDDVSRLLHKLMVSLGFGGGTGGYIAHGGNIGSRWAQTMGREYGECKAVHVNTIYNLPPEPRPPLSPPEQALMKRNQAFQAHGFGYAVIQGTRPSTMSFVLQSSPVGLLAWIGEKYLAWTDEEPSIRTILDSVSLYWLTETITRCFYPYRAVFGGTGNDTPPFLDKPFGFSSFPKESLICPKSWAAAIGRLEFYREHASGGHFAALEKPKELWGDVEEFVGIAWKG